MPARCQASFWIMFQRLAPNPNMPMPPMASDAETPNLRAIDGWTREGPPVPELTCYRRLDT